MKINGRLILFTLLLVILATACKFFFGPNLEWSGFSPIIAIALFSGMMIPQKNASFLLPLLSLFISDLVIHLLYQEGLFAYPGFFKGQYKYYLLLLLPTLIGWILKGRKYSAIAIGAVASPTLFYLVSNFNVWITNEVTYTRDFNGLIECYIAALPFYKNALIATVLFLPLILVSYNYIMRQKAQLLLKLA